MSVHFGWKAMLEIPDDRCERHRLFKAIDDAFKAGAFETLGKALGGSARWFDERMPFELGLGHPLEYAIYWSPIAFIGTLLGAGSNPNYEDHAGFPSLIAALSTERPDRLEIVRILIEHGANPNMRGVNDWTPLHYAVSLRDTDAIRLLLASGADPSLKTRIDDYETALEGADEAGFEAGASLMREAMSRCR
ncbi:ankyrin repeat domain-containing protein [Mesorhizobium sp. M1C.F.Ca.ET.193.01.1.1]|uniref:ankyrin repeat domain-containing protein n=1 Tax=unclassified Mesorhizobium TaxID=325217 RepID=UPI000FD36799|nr:MULTISPECIES: ankyrin repeat domain-containing protein [unclassified Mesorhizobium]TGT03252.1 ankyrin repeat domain-containing protein [bacterium M00.F.Ca.ET.177.01.1.1]TGQ55929.1 ankyrin repeat domain-containing protein [Mesorhizobium sp. M1C.F.Ca.ET.210.01.1.1]TGQ75014.1 ankyrin repeat domain-containing protein [Mesorhizobium sp. M1C.F.Ca.ET.212.01.1.1]TGR13426.1 ankyrin repeat domain-containing protein [Mesorhizobium sp. M1C.F.Ca.ET.204.01.1.1]TGR33703.1 ankyrin repeat domain-containing 